MRDQGSGAKVWTAVVVAMAAMVSLAFQPIPKASARALGVTRGKSFKSGLVFVNGKLIPPPYVVERWGTGIRINQTPVTGQVIDWNEFLKTQSGVKVEKDETAPEASAPAPVAEPAPAAAPAVSAAADVNSLDDLFDDDADSKSAPAAKPASRPAAVTTPAVRPAKPRVTVSYSLDGAFVPNDSTKAMIRKINQTRTEIDKFLRSGGFICFGESYPRVSADSRTLTELLDKLPELQQKATNEDSFVSSLHAAGLVYLNETLMRELYRNRIDYLQLRRIRQSLRGTLDFL